MMQLQLKIISDEETYFDFQTYDTWRQVKLCTPADLTFLLLCKKDDARTKYLLEDIKLHFSKKIVPTIVTELKEACEGMGLVPDDHGQKIKSDRRRRILHERPHLVLADLDAKGVQFIETLKKFPETKNVPAILFYAEETDNSLLAAARKLGVVALRKLDYYGYHIDLIIKIIDQTLRPISLQVSLEKVHELLENYGKGIFHLLSRLSTIKGEYSTEHPERVALYCLAIGLEMGLPEEELNILFFSALAHDIGKLHIPAEVVLKPGRLNDVEYKIMAKHSSIGAHILSKASMLEEVAFYTKYHHEKWDGTGYNKKKGEEIPLLSRIICLADAYDAMTSERRYRGNIKLCNLPKKLRTDKDLFINVFGAGAWRDVENIVKNNNELAGKKKEVVFKIKDSYTDILKKISQLGLSPVDTVKLLNVIEQAEKDRRKTPEEAVEEIKRCSGKQFDPYVVERGFLPTFKKGMPLPDIEERSFFDSPVYKARGKNLKGMNIFLLGELTSIGKDLRSAGYTNVQHLHSEKSLEETMDQDQLPQAIVLDHIPTSPKVISWINHIREREENVRLPLIYYAPGEDLTSHQEWKLYKEYGFTDTYAHAESLIGSFNVLLETRLKERFLEEESLYNLLLIAKMRKELIQMLTEIVTKQHNDMDDNEPVINVRGHENPQSVSKNARKIAQHMGQPIEVQDNISIGALLPVGELFIDDECTEAEYISKNYMLNRAIIVENSLKVLSSIPGFEPILPIIKNVYENYNGEGSLYGRSGEDIPLEARILRVAVAYYVRKGDLKSIKEDAGILYDPLVVKALEEILQEENSLVGVSQ
jgi:HD-GYP domain-containing protein (c-di-GMP phosphodiesterase class II)